MSSGETELCGAETRDGTPCQRPPMDNGRCYHHGGESTGPPEGTSNNFKHGLHASVETFLSEAPERHIDAYHALFEAICTRFERRHGREPDYFDKKQLSQAAKDLAAQDNALEYMKAKAVDSEHPLTEKQLQDIDGAKQVEALHKEWEIMRHVRRENRLLLKDMGLYNSPEQQQAEATSDLGELVAEALED